MPRRGWPYRLTDWLVLAACVAGLGCESTPSEQAVISGIGPARRVQGTGVAQLATDDQSLEAPPAGVPSEPVLPASTQLEEIESRIWDIEQTQE